MNNLLEIGISNNTIKEMINKNDYLTIEDLDFNYNNVKDIIKYFKNIGINNIDNLLINYNYIFFIDLDIIKEELNKYDINEVVNSINSDSSSIVELLN
jgi:negative regulator of genetic competence, sporulation and motility